jgi:hypothetical protein
MEESEDKSEFKVSDKRRFTKEGESKEESGPVKQESAREEVPEQPVKEKSEEPDRRESRTEEPPLPMDFATFLLSMANTAFFQLGLIKDPSTGEAHKDLPGARQTIDLMALIEEKTRGNLTDQEARILKEALFQLRMAFVEASK